MRTRWAERQAVLVGGSYLVSAPALIGEFLADLEHIAEAYGNELLTLEQAAVETGYSKAHLRRLASLGRLPQQGSAYRPRYRRADLPRKAGRDEISSHGGAA